jgi:four helix bundle protein
MSSAQKQQSPLRHFYDLEIWKKAHNLCTEIYKITNQFPTKETYGVSDQLRRASSSIGANIAEGFGRYHYKEKIKFYYNARGSLCEVENFLFLAKDLHYIEKGKARIIFKRYEDLNKRMNQFIKSVQKKMTSD